MSWVSWAKRGLDVCTSEFICICERDPAEFDQPFQIPFATGVHTELCTVVSGAPHLKRLPASFARVSAQAKFES